MIKFPVDEPKIKVIKALELLGFYIVREKEHISMVRENEDGTKTPLTILNHSKKKVQPYEQSAAKQKFLVRIFYNLIQKHDKSYCF